MNLEKYNKDMEEEFDKEFNSLYGINVSVFNSEPVMIGNPPVVDIKSFIKSSHKSLLKKIAEEEVEILKEQKKPTSLMPKWEWVIGYNDCIEDQITHWKEIISKLD